MIKQCAQSVRDKIKVVEVRNILLKMTLMKIYQWSAIISWCFKDFVKGGRFVSKCHAENFICSSVSVSYRQYIVISDFLFDIGFVMKVQEYVILK